MNLAFGGRLSVRELAERIAAMAGRQLKISWLPPRPGDVRDSQAANERLRQLFPEVSPVPLGEGLERTVAWFLAQPQYAPLLTAVPR